MPFRDVENLMIYALENAIVLATGIPSGSIYAFKPPIELVNKPDGAYAPTGYVYLPAIGIDYTKDPIHSYNNYQDPNPPLVIGPSGSVTQYDTIGNLDLHLGISIFAQTKSSLRNYVTQLYQYLMANPYMLYIGDVVPAEYCRVDVVSQKTVRDEYPYQKVMMVVVSGRLMKETAGTPVYIIQTDIAYPASGIVSSSGQPIAFTYTTSGRVFYDN